MPPKNGSDIPIVPAGPSARGSGGNFTVAGVKSNDWFSPFQPLRPLAPGSVSGRTYDYAVGVNLDVAPRSELPINFSQLRAMAQGCDLLRLVIETRKDQVAAYDWKIKKRDTAKSKLSDNGEQDDRAVKLEKFFRQPSRDYDFDEWVRAILEDLFVLDAVAIYKWRRNNGDLYSLDPLDAATIKLLIDSSGRRPIPPSPAYQQILKGIQAVDYMKARDQEFDASRIMAEPNAEVTAEDFMLDELIYKARNVRTWTPYGFSPVEQIIITVNTAIRRSIHQLAYYTDGNMSDHIIGLPAEWTPDMVAEFQKYWDSVNQGNSQERRKGRFVSGDAKVFSLREPALKDEYDEWLARVICYAFSLPPTPFVRQMNRASAEIQQDTAHEEGLQPLLRWIKTFIDKIIVNDFGELDYEFSWQDDVEVDLESQANADKIYISSGVLDQNEVREKLGKDPRPEANKLGVITGAGFIPLGSMTEETGGQAVGRVAPGQSTKGNQNGAGTDPKANKSGGGANAAPGEGKPGTDQHDKPVTKAAEDSGLKKKPAGYDLTPNNALVAHTTANAAKKIKHILDTNKAAVLSALRHRVDVVKAAGRFDDSDIALLVDMVDLQGADAALHEDLKAVYTDSASFTLGTLAIRPGTDIFNQVNTDAQAWANQNAAELVTQISETTRDGLRATLSKMLTDGSASTADIAAQLSTWYGFSERRAQFIAATEMGNAAGNGALDAMKVSKANGMNVMKEWLANDGIACPICQENEDAGPIDLEDSFPSGDDAPLAHPNCACTILAIHVEDEG